MIYSQSILKKYGIENVFQKLDEEIAEYQESGGIDELADILNVLLTVDCFFDGTITQIAYEKRNRTTFRMAANWYDDNGQKPRKGE